MDKVNILNLRDTMSMASIFLSYFSIEEIGAFTPAQFTSTILQRVNEPQLYSLIDMAGGTSPEESMERLKDIITNNDILSILKYYESSIGKA